MSYKDDYDESGCLVKGFFIALIIIAMISQGVRSCINGNINLPKHGSHKVSGGSGGYGTSNGYNVKYKNTTNPNFNSSTKDYGYTNSYPTEYKEGINSYPTSKSIHTTHTTQSNPSTLSNNSTISSISSGQNTMSSSSHSLQTTQSSSYLSSNNNQSQQSTICNSTAVSKETCPRCGGKGEIKEYYYHDSYGGVVSCFYCSRTDAHSHEKWVTCPMCFGKGYEEYVTCSHCNGSGYRYDALGNRQICLYCLGEGKNKRYR